jgi:hypothetical protein
MGSNQVKSMLSLDHRVSQNSNRTGYWTSPG